MAKMPSPSNNPPTDVLTAMTGYASLDRKSYKPKRGSQMASEPRPINVMVIGDWATGKTRIIIDLLKLGKRVLGVMVDFGGTGFNTVLNYFLLAPELGGHPEERFVDGKDLLDNFLAVTLDYAGFVDFRRDPTSIINDVWTDFDPDVVFVDGLSGYQQCELEGKISNWDPLHEKKDGFKDWGKAQNGTLFPLFDILKLVNPSGKVLHKFVTCGEEKKTEWEKTGQLDRQGQEERAPVPGSTKYGPLLHTGARKTVGAGFDIVLRCVRKEFMGKSTFTYEFQNDEAMLKQRGLGLPNSMPANFIEVWQKYIAPLHEPQGEKHEPVVSN